MFMFKLTLPRSKNDRLELENHIISNHNNLIFILYSSMWRFPVENVSSLGL